MAKRAKRGGGKQHRGAIKRHQELYPEMDERVMAYRELYGTGKKVSNMMALILETVPKELRDEASVAASRMEREPADLDALLPKLRQALLDALRGPE